MPTVGTPSAAARCVRPVSTPTTPREAQKSSPSSRTDMRAGTVALPIAPAMRSARSRSASLPQGSTTGMPSAWPSAIQRASGQSLSSRLVMVRSTE